MPKDQPIDEMLRARGFDTPESSRAARRALEAAGLTNPRKISISVEKAPRISAILESEFFRACDHPCCSEYANTSSQGRKIVVVTPSSCQVCSGGSNRRALKNLIWHLEKRCLQSILVVGGMRESQIEICKAAEGSRVEFRMVDGLKLCGAGKRASKDVMWADIVVIWGSTPLRHVLSGTYKDRARGGLLVVTASRRSIEAMCQDVLRTIALSA